MLRCLDRLGNQTSYSREELQNVCSDLVSLIECAFCLLAEDLAKKEAGQLPMPPLKHSKLGKRDFRAVFAWKFIWARLDSHLDNGLATGVKWGERTSLSIDSERQSSAERAPAPVIQRIFRGISVSILFPI